MESFYESQLAVLALFCTVAVFLERRAAKQKRLEERVDTIALDASNASENGTANGGWRADKGGSSPTSVLSRQYLVVYAIVMGEWVLCHFFRDVYVEGLG